MRIIQLAKSVSFLFTALFFVTTTGMAQSYDYEKRPRLNFKFTEARIDFQVNPDDQSLQGSVEYTVEANVSQVDTLSLKAEGLQVDSVLTDGQTVPYDLKDGALNIAVNDSTVMGRPYRVQIYYHGSPRFGLLKSSEGSIWTSALPRSVRHWVPSVDHPAVSLKNTLSITVPEQYTVSATGVKTDEEVVAGGNKKWTFRSGRPVPVTAVSFALGMFNEEGVSYGIKRINTYAEPLAIPPGRQREIADEARHIIRQVEDATGLKYPYPGLQIVFLNDHYWETKSYGASFIYLYKNRGDWQHQLRRGIYAQWFGIYQREAQWSASWPIQLFQTALHYMIEDKAATLETAAEPEANPNTVYENFEVDRWNWWQNFNQWPQTNVQETAGRIIPDVLRQGPGSYTPAAYEDIWYQLSGQPVINIPEFVPAQDVSSSQNSNAVVYRVDYTMVPGEQSLQLAFKPIKRMANAQLKMMANIFSGGTSSTVPVTVSGATDTAAIAVPAGTQNVMLHLESPAGVQLEEHKPVPFLLYQLRNGETTEAKKQAAIQIGYHSENPDLQLALDDLIDQPMEPEVEAALLRSFGAITNGAAGTQNRFLDALNSDNPKIQAAALDVLQNYPENQQVTQRIQQLSGSATNDALANRAMELYMERIDSTKFVQYANTLVQQDTAGTKAIVAIGHLARMGKTKKAVDLAKFYIEPVYSYTVRRQALRILLDYDTSAEAWSERLAMLLADPDPRIRFITVQNIDTIPGIDPAAVLQEHKSTEYDGRVLEVMSDKL